VHELSLQAWEGTFALNATPAFLAAREALRAMLDQPPGPSGTRGSVVLMSSVLAWDPMPALFATHAYAAAKAATVS
jgi:NAD(P)-dependent dehydrogenase (short-subunit alcohol dehydrogenase family)